MRVGSFAFYGLQICCGLFELSYVEGGSEVPFFRVLLRF